MAGDDGAAAVGAYEAKRLQRIQQNQQMLQSLGIDVQPRERKRRIFTRDETNDESPVEPRRSSRLQQQPTIQDPPLELGPTPRSVRVRQRRGPEYTPVQLAKVEAIQPQQQRPTGKLTRQSSSLLHMDMASFHDRWLGKQIWPKGKATVMEGMCPLHVPSFSRMLGIQQWRNGVVLFVNVHRASGYENSFTEMPHPDATNAEPAAVHFRWFAQERQHEASPAIVRLLAAQRGDPTLWLDGAATEPPPPALEQKGTTCGPVLLFLRHADGPYIYCGRLAYLGHLREAKPIEFRWQLVDLGKIQWRHVKQLLDAGDQVDGDAVVETPATIKAE